MLSRRHICEPTNELLIVKCEVAEYENVIFSDWLSSWHLDIPEVVESSDAVSIDFCIYRDIFSPWLYNRNLSIPNGCFTETSCCRLVILLKGPLHHRMDGVLNVILSNGYFTENGIVWNVCSAKWSFYRNVIVSNDRRAEWLFCRNAGFYRIQRIRCLCRVFICVHTIAWRGLRIHCEYVACQWIDCDSLTALLEKFV